MKFGRGRNQKRLVEGMLMLSGISSTVLLIDNSCVETSCHLSVKELGVIMGI